MGILDMIQSIAGQGNTGATPNAQVTGGLVEELQHRPGGLGSLLQAFHQNGMSDQVQQWGSGQTAPADPGQIERGLGGTGIIDSIAKRTGMSPAMIKMGLGVAVPVLIHHLVSNGHVDQQGNQTGSEPEMGGMLQSVLGRIL
jgi:uncharacterized protein YidB (DUF937 family)